MVFWTDSWKSELFTRILSNLGEVDAKTAGSSENWE